MHYIGGWGKTAPDFGLSCSADIFQRKVGDAIVGIQGVRDISDGICIGGVDKAQHDERLVSPNLKSPEGKPAECERSKMFDWCFHCAVLRAYRQWRRSITRSEEGRCPAVRSTNALSNASEVRSWLSSAVFCSRLIKNFATMTRPLRRLACNGVPW